MPACVMVMLVGVIMIIVGFEDHVAVHRIALWKSITCNTGAVLFYIGIAWAVISAIFGN